MENIKENKETNKFSPVNDNDNCSKNKSNIKRNPTISESSKSLSRDYSFQSDDGISECSSVESILDLRKPDPEEMLMELGFGPDKKSIKATRIPERFLKPSVLLPHIDIDKFVEEYELRRSNNK